METQSQTVKSRRLSTAQRGAFLGALIGWIFDYYEVFLMTILVVPIRTQFGLTTKQVGFLFSIQLIFLAIGGVFFGYLADRIGRKRVLTYTIVIFSLGTMARAIAPDYMTLLLLTAVAGFGIGGEYGVGQTLVTETIEKEHRGFYSAFLYGGIYVGILFGALVGGHLTPLIGWRMTFAISGLPVLFALWVRRHTPESEAWLERRRQAAFNVTSTPKFSLRLWRTWLLCVFAAGLQFFAYYGVASFLPTYLISKGSTMAGASSWLIFTAFSGAVGCAIGALLSDRVGRRFTLSLLSGMACIGGICLALQWSSLLAGGPGVMVSFFVLFAGSNGAAVFGVLFSESFPTEHRAVAVSSALQVGRGLSFFPPLIAAALLPTLGYQPIIVLSAVLFAVLSLVAWLFKANGDESLQQEYPRTASISADESSALR